MQRKTIPRAFEQAHESMQRLAAAIADFENHARGASENADFDNGMLAAANGAANVLKKDMAAFADELVNLKVAIVLEMDDRGMLPVGAQDTEKTK